MTPDASAPIRVVLFCGGRGSATIIRALLRHSEVDLSLIVNAYDDGLSTGALRNFIPGMLGPSDFRKNLSYLLGNYSHAQYALKHLIEYRLPESTSAEDVDRLARFSTTNDLTMLPEPVKGWFAQLPLDISARMRELLGSFFAHAATTREHFDYRDCSLGNLVFAGAYLLRDRDFNAAAADIGALVGARAKLFNVSSEQNRILAGLKQDGTFLSCEAEIVGPQSPSPITNLYLLESPLTTDETGELGRLDVTARQICLAARDAVPNLSPGAAKALAEADIILYGPGTQHSSLLPSYRIAGAALRQAPAPIKALVMNLDSDNDIQGLSAPDIVDRVIGHGGSITHILLNRDTESGRLPEGDPSGSTWCGATVLRGSFANRSRPHAHNGTAVVEQVLDLHMRLQETPATVDIFADIHNRSVASDELIEEFLEMNWSTLQARLVLNRVAPPNTLGLAVSGANHGGLFPESGYFKDWLLNGTSDYLVLMTGDGAYSFRDVQSIMRLLEQQPSLGGVFGSRTQSRRQFITSIQAAYGEHRFLYRLGKLAAIFLSLVFYLRTGIIFSDPLTGLRVFRRQNLSRVTGIAGMGGNTTPLAIVRLLIRHGVEVAEIPVLYRTFSGFTDPYWRIRRGLYNLASMLGR